MARQINIYGPPGTGKTRTLTKLFVALAQRLGGPDRVAAITYTRAGADELRLRAGVALGLDTDLDNLRREMPHVGTIHALAWHLLDRPKIVSDGQVATWVGGRGGEDDEWVPGDTAALKAIALKVYSASRQMLTPFDAALKRQGPLIERQAPLDVIRPLIVEYETWLMEKNLTDFDSLATQAWGRKATLPGRVRAILVDEAQDNSPLLWKILDNWEANRPLVIRAGDPWQALYTYAGAAPELFLRRPGDWKVLATSHRLDHHAAQYAKKILRDAGWGENQQHDYNMAENLLKSWKGKGGFKQDDSVLYLARTRRLLNQVEKDMWNTGTPYRVLGGGGPLETKAGKSAITLVRVAYAGEAVPVTELQSALGHIRNRRDLPGPEILDPYVGEMIDRARFFEIAKTASLWQYVSPTPWGNYAHEVYRKHGLDGLLKPSKTRIGSIHAAKGREADRVFLLRSWGTEPGSKLDTPEGMREEACVAYVGATRHRVELTLLDGGYGRAYPFRDPHGSYIDLEEEA